jgi:hypothetical protein
MFSWGEAGMASYVGVRSVTFRWVALGRVMFCLGQVRHGRRVEASCFMVS